MPSSIPQDPTRLPAEVTTFVGRRSDVAAIRRLASGARMVTLTGFGGLGKTRLALHAASEMRRAFRDGVCLVELAALTNPALLPHTALEALGAPSQSGRTPIDRLCDELAQRQLLLILDNCEHVIEAAADLATAVLARCPGVTILATSRQPLRISGEYLYPVSPLPLPPSGPDPAPGAATQSPAVALLVDRVTAAVPEFTLSAQNEGALIRLCRQLEGIPLAIELAASRLKVLEIDELVERLRDRSITLRERNRSFPERHRTLEALIDWSSDLCTASERLLWARISVFIGTFSLQDVEAVCTDEALPHDEVVDVLSSLVDRSVVIREVHGDRVRFRMLDTLRAYGQAKLAATGSQEQWARRHRDWYAELITRAGNEWVGPKQKEWAERLRAEHPNIRLALEFSVSDPDEVDVALRMAACAWYWLGMEHLPEGRLWLARALALPSPPSHDRAWALGTDAYLARFQGDPAAAAQRAREAREMATALGDVAAQALAAHVTGVCLMLGEDPASALPHFREALDLYARCDVQPQYHDALLVETAVTHIFLDERTEARERIDQVLARCRETGDRWQLAYALWGEAYLALLDGRSDGEPELLQAIAIKREFGDSLGLALTVEVLAWTTVRDDPERAARLLGIADSLWHGVGARQLAAQRKPYEDAARARLGRESFEALVARGAAVEREDALAFALREPRETSVSAPAHGANVLTARQLEVAQLVAEGMSNKEIAAKLVISLRTAEGHVESILTKLGFTTRTQIATWVHQQD